jgi:hypothetical protein
MFEAFRTTGSLQENMSRLGGQQGMKEETTPCGYVVLEKESGHTIQEPFTGYEEVGLETPRQPLRSSAFIESERGLVNVKSSMKSDVIRMLLDRNSMKPRVLASSLLSEWKKRHRRPLFSLSDGGSRMTPPPMA